MGEIETGEKEALFEQLSLQMGYATFEQVVGVQQQRASSDFGGEADLGDVLVAQGILTPEQRDKIEDLVSIQAGEVQMVVGFEVLEKMGMGSYGAVFRAVSPATNQLAALKIVPPCLARNEEYIEQFTDTMAKMRRMPHANLAGCVSSAYDEQTGLHYCAMEFVDGETLEMRLARDGMLEEHDALVLIRQVAFGLQHAQRAGMLHGNIKPSNIMIGLDGVAKVLDLGLAPPLASDDAELITSGAFGGRPRYASPEQARMEAEIDQRSDIYSLGAVFYQMVTGQEPFSGMTSEEICEKHLDGELPWPGSINPRLSEHTALIIEKMMAKEAGDRYKTYFDLLMDIDAVLNAKSPSSHMLDPGKSTVSRTLQAPPSRRMTAPTAFVPPVAEKKESFLDYLWENKRVILYWTAIPFGVVILALTLHALFRAGTGGGVHIEEPDSGRPPKVVKRPKTPKEPKEPVVKPVEPVEPVVKPVEPVVKPVEPVEPVVKPVEPVEPVVKPVEPDTRLVAAEKAYKAAVSQYDKYGAYATPALEPALREVVETYGDTEYGAKAKEMLAGLKPPLRPVEAWVAEGFPSVDWKGFDAVYGPETKQFNPRRAFLSGSREIRWEQRRAKEGGVLALSGGPQQVAYTHLTVTSGAAQKALLCLGAGNAAKVWVNGKLVYADSPAEAGASGKRSAEVSLKTGDNEILLKGCRGEGEAEEFFGLAAKGPVAFGVVVTQTSAAATGQKMPALLLIEFDTLIEQGAYVRAWERMQEAAEREDDAALEEGLRNSASVAASLLGRREAIRKAAGELARQQETTIISTRNGEMEGRVVSVSDAGIMVLKEEEKEDGAVEKQQVAVRWSDLTAEQEERLAAAWRPEGAAGEIAKAYMALMRKDGGKARELAASAGTHPLAAHIRNRAEVQLAAAGKAKAAAEAAARAAAEAAARAEAEAAAAAGEPGSTEISAAPAETATATDWRSLFDGSDDMRWEKDGKVSVSEGVLTAEDVADVFYRGEWEEFVLECEISGTSRIAGVGILGIGLAHPGRSEVGGNIVNILFHGNGDVHVFVPGNMLWKAGPGKLVLEGWQPLRLEFRRDSLKVFGGKVLLNTVALPKNVIRKGGLHFYSYMFGCVGRVRNVRVGILSR